MDFTHRSYELEIMDNLDCSGEVVDQSLRELEFINKWLGGDAVTINAFTKILKKTSSRNLTVVDVGCGSGLMLKLINDWGNKHNFKFTLIGVDANPNIIRFARENIKGYSNISFRAIDIFSKEFQEVEADIFIGTLFFHHFTNEQLTDFFAHLKKQVRLGIIINDIHRHPLAYYSIKWLTAAFSKSSMVKHDGPLSVRRAFYKQELQAILRNAGYSKIDIHWKWAFRWELIALQD